MRRHMTLTKLVCDQAKPKEKTYTLTDGDGLSLEISANGSKYWIVRYRQNGKPFRRSLGVYPGVSIKEAREKNFALHKNLDEGIFSDVRGEKFADVAKEWFDRKIGPVTKKTYFDGVASRLKNHILPVIGGKTLKEVTPPVVLSICQKLEDENKEITAHKVKGIIGQVFRYAIATGRADFDPTYALMRALRPTPKNHMPALTEAEDIARLMKAIDEYPDALIRAALKFHALVFLRPSETLYTSWKEINVGKAQITIPESRMKMKRVHVVPLARQTLSLLEEIRKISGDSEWLFPARTDPGAPVGSWVLRRALREMGFAAYQMSLHGFRGMASTVLNNHSFPIDHIETQLSHAESNTVRGAYNHAEYLPQRREMMQWWADWLDGLEPQNI